MPKEENIKLKAKYSHILGSNAKNNNRNNVLKDAVILMHIAKFSRGLPINPDNWRK